MGLLDVRTAVPLYPSPSKSTVNGTHIHSDILPMPTDLCAAKKRPNVTEICSFAIKSKALQVKRGWLTRQYRCRDSSRSHRGLSIRFNGVHLSTFCNAQPCRKSIDSGQITNLKLTCKHLHGRMLAAGEVFSFWHQVGPPWWLRGFVTGREIRTG